MHCRETWDSTLQLLADVQEYFIKIIVCDFPIVIDSVSIVRTFLILLAEYNILNEKISNSMQQSLHGIIQEEGPSFTATCSHRGHVTPSPPPGIQFLFKFLAQYKKKG